MLSLGPTLVVLVVYVLASMRLTRLINADSITDFIRIWVGNRARQHELLTDEAFGRNQIETAKLHATKVQRWTKAFKFVQCPWCVGFWWPLLGAPLAIWVIKYGWTLDWWAIVPLALAASHVIGLMARFADTEEIEIEEVEDDEAAAS